MDSILDILFLSEIRFPQSKKQERDYTAALDAIIQAEKDIQDKLPSAYQSLVKAYTESLEAHQSLCCQSEFERGFLCGGLLLLEFIIKAKGPER